MSSSSTQPPQTGLVAVLYRAQINKHISSISALWRNALCLNSSELYASMRTLVEEVQVVIWSERGGRRSGGRVYRR